MAARRRKASAPPTIKESKRAKTDTESTSFRQCHLEDFSRTRSGASTLPRPSGDLRTAAIFENSTRNPRPHIREATQSATLSHQLTHICSQAIVAEDLTATVSNIKPGLLTCPSAIILVNKQVRSEFMDELFLSAGSIVAVVRDFDFRHIVRFYNRMSEHEERVTAGKVRNRNITIRLDLPKGYRRKNYLKRWINRISHATKKGAQLTGTYELGDHPARFGTRWVIGHVRSFRKMGAGPRKDELRKILAPMVNRPNRGDWMGRPNQIQL